uniref:Secreted protein n=1 Tax=Ascaris lumbricoides TaxID=6252 RepID=A0A0M3HHJ8_ASCLU
MENVECTTHCFYCFCVVRNLILCYLLSQYLFSDHSVNCLGGEGGGDGAKKPSTVWTYWSNFILRVEGVPTFNSTRGDQPFCDELLMLNLLW